MKDLVDSMVRFSAAMTLFSMQQFQNALGAPADSKAAIEKFTQSLDSVTNAISSHIDHANREALDSVSKLGIDLVDRSLSVLESPALDPRQMLKTSGDLMRKTSDSLNDWVKKTSDSEKSAGEPQLAAEALGSSGKRSEKRAS